MTIDATLTQCSFRVTTTLGIAFIEVTIDVPGRGKKLRFALDGAATSRTTFVIIYTSAIRPSLISHFFIAR